MGVSFRIVLEWKKIIGRACIMLNPIVVMSEEAMRIGMG